MTTLNEALEELHRAVRDLRAAIWRARVSLLVTIVVLWLVALGFAIWTWLT